MHTLWRSTQWRNNAQAMPAGTLHWALQGVDMRRSETEEDFAGRQRGMQH